MYLDWKDIILIISLVANAVGIPFARYFLAYSSANNPHMERPRTDILSMARCFLMVSIYSTRVSFVTGLSKSSKGQMTIKDQMTFKALLEC